MRVSKMMLLLPALGLIALAPIQPASAEHCTKSTTFESSVIVDSPVILEPTTTTFTRVIERPVMVRETLSPVLIERPVMVDRPVVVEKRVVVDRPVMMEKRILEQPIIVNKERRHLLRLSIF